MELLKRIIKIKKKTNIIYDHNSMSTKKIITKSNLHQIKTKQKSLTYTSLEDMGPVLNATGYQVHKNEKNWQRSAKLKNTFLFLKTSNFTVINVIRRHLKSLKFSYISIGSD